MDENWLVLSENNKGFVMWNCHTQRQEHRIENSKNESVTTVLNTYNHNEVPPFISFDHLAKSYFLRRNDDRFELKNYPVPRSEYPPLSITPIDRRIFIHGKNIYKYNYKMLEQT